jgi:hypothetical protein
MGDRGFGRAPLVHFFRYIPSNVIGLRCEGADRKISSSRRILLFRIVLIRKAIDKSCFCGLRHVT